MSGDVHVCDYCAEQKSFKRRPEGWALRPFRGFEHHVSASRSTITNTHRNMPPTRDFRVDLWGRLSNPASMVLGGDNGAPSPTSGGSARRPGPPVQRRLTPSDLEAVVARYQSGRSLNDLATEFGVHHRTVADHLKRLGIARRVNLAKLNAADVKRAASRYRAGASLATVGMALNVDASTVQRAFKRAGVPIRPRPGC